MIVHLECALRAPRKEVTNLNPRQVPVLPKLDQKLVVLWCEFRPGPTRLHGRLWHPDLFNHVESPGSSSLPMGGFGDSSGSIREMVPGCVGGGGNYGHLVLAGAGYRQVPVQGRI